MSRKQQAWGTAGTLRGGQRAAATLMTPTDARELTATTSSSPETGQERRRQGLGGANPDLMCDCWAYLCGWCRWAGYDSFRKRALPHMAEALVLQKLALMLP